MAYLRDKGEIATHTPWIENFHAPFSVFERKGNDTVSLRNFDLRCSDLEAAMVDQTNTVTPVETPYAGSFVASTVSVSPPMAVAGIIFSMALIAASSGLILAHVPIRMGLLGYDPDMAGWMLTAMSVGGFLGCIGTGFVVRRVGHARAYLFLASLIIMSHWVLTLSPDPVLWIVGRFGYGIAATALFIVSQSWLNDACPNAWRGRVMAIFYMTYVLGIGGGGFLNGLVDQETSMSPLLAVGFVTAATFPVALTSLPTPPPPASVSVAFRAVWKISPVGLVGLLAVGGLSMLVLGFAPIYADAVGFTPFEVGTLLFLMQFGMLAVQFPLGALSDRIDRRYVLVIACALVILFASITASLTELNLWLLIILFGFWSGATETVYAVANAHANDRAEPQYYVSLSMTLLFCWSITGAITPGVASYLVAQFGIEAFMLMAIAIAAAYGLFVVSRIFVRDAVSDSDQEAYELRAAQAPYAPELAAPVPEDVAQKPL